MANEDEILIQFKGVDAGATVAAQKTAKAINDVKDATQQGKKSHDEHGNAAKQLADKMLGLEHRHVSARHAVKLFSEATDIGRGSIMTMSHSVAMLGPALGTALGAFLLFKEAMKEEAEAAAKAKEKTDELAESVRKFREERKEKDTVFQYGEEGAKSHAEETASRKTIESLRSRLREAETGQSKNFETKSFGGKIWEQMGKAASDLMDEVTGSHGNESEEAKSQLRMQIAQMEANEKASKAQAERYKRYQDAMRPAKEAMQEAEMHTAQHGGSAADFKEKIDAQKMMIANLEELTKKAETNAEKEELGNKIKEEEIKLQRLRTEASNKYFADRQKMEKMEGPGVFATKQEKATFAENQRYDVEKREAGQMQKLGFDVDTKALEQKHADEIKKIKMDADNELLMKRAGIQAQQLRNDGDNFAAEKALADAHYKEMMSKDTGNKEMQTLDTEQHNADIQKLTIAHNNEIASYTSNLTQESLRIKGDQFGAEREALQEWQRKELEMHKDQADQIKSVHAQKLADINDREKEHHKEVMFGFKNELINATLGSGVANVASMFEEHRKKQRDKTLTAEEKAAEQQAFDAKIHRMRTESDAEMQGKNKVGFMDLSSAWESFSSSLNRDPMAQKQYEEQKMTNDLLRSIDGKAGGSGVLVG